MPSRPPSLPVGGVVLGRVACTESETRQVLASGVLMIPSARLSACASTINQNARPHKLSELSVCCVVGYDLLYKVGILHVSSRALTLLLVRHLKVAHSSMPQVPRPSFYPVVFGGVLPAP